TENQIIAAVSGLVATLLLYIIGWPAETAGNVLGPLLRYLSVTEHFSEMVKGLVDTRGLVYFVSLIALALFLTQRSVESLRWRYPPCRVSVRSTASSASSSSCSPGSPTSSPACSPPTFFSTPSSDCWRSSSTSPRPRTR